MSHCYRVFCVCVCVRACLLMFSFVPFHYQTAEKGLDLNVLWRPRHSASAAKKNDAVAAPVAPSRGVTSTFKRWRRSGGDRQSPGHSENCSSKEPAGEEDRSLLKFLALVSGIHRTYALATFQSRSWLRNMMRCDMIFC